MALGQFDSITGASGSVLENDGGKEVCRAFPMNEWIEELSDLSAAGEPAVLVTVAGIRGSAPREIGA